MVTRRRPGSDCAKEWPCTASGIQRSHSCSVQPYSRSNDAGTGWEGVEEKKGEADDTSRLQPPATGGQMASTSCGCSGSVARSAGAM
jgi:hypothetical protein